MRGVEAARRAGGDLVPGAYRLALGSDVGDHSRLSAAMDLAGVGKLPSHEGPCHLSRAVAYPVLDPAACPSLDPEGLPSLAQVVRPSLALGARSSLAQGAYPSQAQEASHVQAQVAYADRAGTEGHQTGAYRVQDHIPQEASQDARPSVA